MRNVQCHKDMFWFSEFTSPISTRLINIKLACNFCYATYRLNTYKAEDGSRAPSNLVQAYQGTKNGQIDELWDVKEIKRYLYDRGVI